MDPTKEMGNTGEGQQRRQHTITLPENAHTREQIVGGIEKHVLPTLHGDDRTYLERQLNNVRGGGSEHATR